MQYIGEEIDIRVESVKNQVVELGEKMKEKVKDVKVKALT